MVQLSLFQVNLKYVSIFLIRFIKYEVPNGNIFIDCDKSNLNEKKYKFLTNSMLYLNLSSLGDKKKPKSKTK